MLYIGRKECERIYLSISADLDPEMKVKDLLSEPICIEVMEINKSTVKVGIEAPHCINIAREEVYDKDKTLTIEVQGVGE